MFFQVCLGKIYLFEYQNRGKGRLIFLRLKILKMRPLNYLSLSMIFILIISSSVLGIDEDEDIDKDKKNKDYLDEVGYLIKVFGKKLRKKVRKQIVPDIRIPIVHFSINSELNYIVRDYVLKRLEGIKYKNRNFSFVQCPEAINIRSEIRGGELILTKGIHSRKFLMDLMEAYQTDHYAEVILVKKDKMIEIFVNIYSAEQLNAISSIREEVRIALKKNILYQFSIGYLFNLKEHPSDSFYSIFR